MPGNSGPRCGIERAKRVLDDAGRQTLDLLLDDHEQHGWTDRDIAEALTALLEGRDGPGSVGRQTIAFHRRGDCRCD